MRPARHTILLAAVALTLAATAACSDSSDNHQGTDQPDDETTEPRHGDDQPDPGSADPDHLTTLPAPTGDATQAIQPVTELLSLTGAELACTADAVRADPELHAAIEANPDKDSDAGREITRIARNCINQHTGADNFADTAQRNTAAQLTDQQLECLRDGYRDLDPDQLDDILAAALEPTDDNQNTRNQITNIYRDCGIDQ